MRLEYELKDLRETEAFKTMEIQHKGLTIGIILIDKELAHIPKNMFKELIIQ